MEGEAEWLVSRGKSMEREREGGKHEEDKGRVWRE